MSSQRDFSRLLSSCWHGHEKTMVCIGLDSEYERVPECVRRSGNRAPFQALLEFNTRIINATHDLVCAYKINSAFYEEHPDGLEALACTAWHIREVAPDVAIIDDAKRGDIGNSNNGYARSVFDVIGADAVTVHNYLGGASLQPFLDRPEKGIIVLCRTSNPEAGEFQDRLVAITDEEAEKWSLPKGTYMPLYQLVAYRVSQWNRNGNCALVVGATYPKELEEVRKIVGDMPILVPGIGAQGGDLEKTLRAGKDSRGRGLIINSARNIIFASSGEDFAEAARRETIELLDATQDVIDDMESESPRY